MSKSRKLVESVTEAEVPIQRQVKTDRQLNDMAVEMEVIVNDVLPEIDLFDTKADAVEAAMKKYGITTGDEDTDMDLTNDIQTTIDITTKVNRVELGRILQEYGVTIGGKPAPDQGPKTPGPEDRVKRSIDYRGDDDDYDEAGNDLTQQATGHPAE